MLGKKNGAGEPKVLEVDATLQGNLQFKDAVNLRINGCFEGRLETGGELIIAAWIARLDDPSVIAIPR